MDAIRLYAEFTDDCGVDWKLNIHDSSYGGSATEFVLGPAGFVLSYEGSNENRYQPIIPSSVEFTLVEQNTTDAQILDLIPGAEEGRFTVTIYRDTAGANTLYWAGVILAELLVRPDEYYPIFNQLTAVDDLGSLADIDASVLVTSGVQTIREVLLDALNQTRAAHAWGATDVFLKSVNDFVAANYAGADQLADIYVSSSTWIEEYDDDDATASKYYTVHRILESIAVTFNARIFQSEGAFWFMPVGAHMSGLVQEVRHHHTDGTEPASSPVTVGDHVVFGPGFNGFKKMSGYEHTHLAPAKRVDRSYKYYGNSAQIAVSAFPELNFGTVTLNDTGEHYAAGTELYVSGLFQFNYAPDSTTGSNRVGRVELQIKLKVGGQYLSRAANFAGSTIDFLIFAPDEVTYTPSSYASASWSSSSAVRYDIISQIFDRDDGAAGSETVEIPFAILTPGLPSDQEGMELEISLVGRDDTGAIDSAITIGGDYFINGLRVDEAGVGESNGDQVTYSATNSATGTRVVITSPDVLIGDEVSMNSRGGLFLWANGATGGWNSTQHTGTAMGIHRLGVQEILAGQKSATRVQRGTFYGSDMAAMWKLILDSSTGDLLLSMEMSYHAARCETTVEVWRVHREITGITNSEGDTKDVSNPVIVAPGNPGGVVADTVALVGAKGSNSIDNMSDVDTSTRAPADGEHLEWVAADSKWKPATAPAAGNPYPTDILLWEGNGAGFPYFTLSNTTGWLDWTTLDGYIDINLDTGSNANAAKQYVIPADGLYEMNFFCMFQNQSGGTETFDVIAGIRSGATPNTTVQQLLRTTLDIANGSVQGLGGVGVFQGTAGTIITPGAQIKTDGSATYRFYYAARALHASIRRIA
jgi:hypothetical protein